VEAQVFGDPEVEALLDQMGPEERVGQLFLVTYYGSDVSETSDIAALLSRYHVGGIVLLSENDNFTDSDDFPTQVAQLTSSLQMLAASQLPSSGSPESPASSGPYVPLFIGLEHDGSGQSHSQLLSGVTPLPSSMAVGATWDPELAEGTGQIVGQELPILGVNLLLGPSADVLETPQPFTSGDLGTWVFGGEPFWVSQMVAAYVRGVHEGSDGHLAVVPRHFPGHGGADRLASVEVPTVRRSLEQLRQLDLIPFFAVTDPSTDPLSVADGLMTGHISYPGFQGDNPRVATPISLDNRALQELMALEPLAAWRAGGGLIISDSLGAQGVRRQYDRQGEDFPGRQIAQKALLAGNDVLYLSDFGQDAATGQTKTIIDTIEFFVQAYRSDSAFQERVDDAVRRILRKKLDLYDGGFDYDDVVRIRTSEIETLGQRGEMTFAVARGAVTLLSPQRDDLLIAPQAGEHIVVFTDTRPVSQCSDCVPRPMIAAEALESAILRLYGPQASKLVTSASIQSFTFEQLVDYLQYGPPESAATDDATPIPDSIGIALDSANWVVFVMLDVSTSVPSSSAVKQFLARPVDADTRIVVMAMAAPYYLDATEVSKLTAYYGLYGYTERFVDVAARALFLGIPFPGASPVSVTGVDYNIIKMTSPDPDQVITLLANREGAATTGETSTPAPVLHKGDVLQLSTGVILDRNQHPVPDGTPVEFVQDYTSEGLRNSIPAVTRDGVAQTSLTLDRAGELKIAVSSIDAAQSDTVTINVSDTGEVIIDIVPPDIKPTETSTPTITPTPLPPTPTPPPLPEQVPVVGIGDLLLSLFGLATISIASFVFGISRRNLNYGLLLSLPTIIFGLSGYNYYALYWPGAVLWRKMLGDTLGAGTITWISSAIGFGLTMLVLYTLERSPRMPSGRQSRDHR